MPLRSFAFIALFSAACSAGVIVTSDGTRYEGDVQRVDGGWQIKPASGKSTFVPAASVRSIELSGGGMSSSAAEGLQSLRRSVEASDDLPRIVERYRKLIAQAAEADVGAEAKQDLATWQDRLNRHLVKAGKQWVTAKEKEAISAAASATAEKARLLIKAGDSKQAGELLEQAQQQDAGNISVLYLQGVLAEQHADLATSKKDFAAVQQAVPDHAPSLLNLSVIAMRQRQWGPAAALMTQALLAAPNTRVLVDAAAELLAALPDEQRKSTVTIKLARLFADQDAQLAKVMAGKKMYRWGATWVDQATFDKLTAAEEAVKKKVADLQSDFSQTQDRIKSIDAQTMDNDSAMRTMEQHSWVVTADGTYVRAPLPSAYYDLQKQNAQLHGERVGLNGRLNALRDAAKQAQADLPAPKFTGHIALIGEDGMPVVVSANVPATPPVRPPAMPTTAPATAPSPPPIIRIGPANGD